MTRKTATVEVMRSQSDGYVAYKVYARVGGKEVWQNTLHHERTCSYGTGYMDECQRLAAMLEAMGHKVTVSLP